MESRKTNRYFYMDYLRSYIIILVVMIHLACTYSQLGSWYYFEERSLDTISILLFAFFQTFTQAYFMGFMFLLAGYFVPSSYDRKGFRRFIKERFICLGIPTLIYMLVIHPFIIFTLLDLSWERPKPSFVNFYSDYVYSLDFIGGSGPLWFAFALLIFSGIYAVIRKISKKTPASHNKELPKLGSISLLIVFIAIGAFLIRIIQPIGTNVMNMQLCFFMQYIVLFILGIKARRFNWFQKITYQWGCRWLKLGILLGILIWMTIFLIGGAQGTHGLDFFLGGLHWQNFTYALWESFVSVSISIGLLAFFKEKINRPNKYLSFLSNNAFTVYVFHAPIIVSLTILLRNWYIQPFLKFIVLTFISLPICFLASHFVFRKIPVLKRIL